ncbi:MAG: S46 family peptidase [Phycisphaerae bacterium]|jgi:hypothetical protein
MPIAATRFRFAVTLILPLAALLTPFEVRGDEGLWPLNQPPTEIFRDKYQFTPGEAWYQKVQRSCVRLGRGGSASLVSRNGLVLTNHHVVSDQLRKLSTPERDLLTDGFLAADPSQELRCQDLDAYVLLGIRDVTAEVNASVTADLTPAAANEARRKKIAELEAQRPDDSSIHSNVVTLYRGAAYHLYRYRRYTDVRLVWAPELRAASFGGDVDNFEYPRYALDAALLRLYDENGAPLHTRDFFQLNLEGVGENEFVMVLGNPSRTQRGLTVDHLRFLRDVEYPAVLGSLWRREVQLRTICERGPEQERLFRSELLGVQNSRKAVSGYLATLQDPRIIASKVEDEAKLRQGVAGNPQWQAQWGDAWDRLTNALAAYRGFFARQNLLNGRGAALDSRLFRIARHLVRYAAEREKPDAERLEEYREAELEPLKLRLFSPAPIEDDVEIEDLASGMALLIERLGGDDPLVVQVLDGRPPRERAAELVRGCGLKDVETRKRLFDGGAAAVAASQDPMIRLATLVDPEARKFRKRYEDEFESVERDAYAQIAAAQFAVFGRQRPPDASGSLRLSFGTVCGVTEGGRTVPAFTQIGGLFERSAQFGGTPPFDLAPSWQRAQSALDRTVPFDFVLTAEAIGGNSGSPVINRAGELVGLVFDINVPALGWNVVYTDQVARSVALDVRALHAALTHVYHADALVAELTRELPE